MNKLKAYYINLKDRTNRNDHIVHHWSDIVELHRVEAVDKRENKQGVLGCFLSQYNAFREIKHYEGNRLCLIMEDDVVPCSDFEKRLNLVFENLPEDWDVLMLGYSGIQNHRFSKVNDYICKAEHHILAAMSYIVNPNFYGSLSMIYKDESMHSHNMDQLLKYLQKNHNVYMAMPAMTYQKEFWSDTSNRLVGNTVMTEKYFKDSL